MKIFFSFLFLLYGLPILFALEVLFDLSKFFTYSIIGFILLISLFICIKRKLIYIDIAKFFLFIFSFILLLIVIIESGSMKTIINLGIVSLLIFISFYYKPVNENKLIKTALLILMLGIYMVYLSTPISYEYWKMHGGRLYIGETKNPNLISFISLMYVLTALYSLTKINFNTFFKATIYLTLPLAFYLYFVSFSKSCIIGLFFLLVYFMSKRKLKTINFILILSIVIIFSTLLNFNFNNYITLIANTINSLLFGSDLNMSASIRHENFKVFLIKYFNMSIFGHGLNTFRLDSPILQLYIEFGLIFAVLFLVFFVIYPLILIGFKRTDSIQKEYATIIYLFYLPNLFFHGTPYEWHTWLPTIIFYTLFKNKDTSYVITRPTFHIQTNTK